MWQSIVVPVDGSLSAERALPIAARLAQKAGARLTILHALDYLRTDFPSCEEPLEWWSENTCDRAKRYLERLADTIAVRYAIRPQSRVLETDAITALTCHEPAVTADLVVMATSGRNAIDRFRLGSTSQRMLTEAKSNLLLIPPNGDVRTERTDKPFGRILVPLDGSANAERALAPAYEVARIDGGQLVLLRVERPQLVRSGAAHSAYDRSHSEEYLMEVADRVAEHSVATDWHISTTPIPAGHEICNFAVEQEIDLIALARRSGSSLNRVLFGGTADTLLHTATTPLLFAAPQPGE